MGLTYDYPKLRDVPREAFDNPALLYSHIVELTRTLRLMQQEIVRSAAGVTTLTASRAVATDSSGQLTASATSATELGYVDGVTSAIQTQLDSKLNSASYTAADVLTKLLTVDGSGSTLDADTVDGKNPGSASGLATLGSDSILVEDADTFKDVAGTRYQTKIIDIGDWDMDATATLAIAHGLTLANIRSIAAYIRDDAATACYGPIPRINNFAGYELRISSLDATNINLSREAGGAFDSTSFNATSFNRGHILIIYTL